jgi:anti-sigma factor ChrR (cupin superfamily)
VKSTNGRIEDAAELAALYLSGAMDARGRAAFEAELAAGREDYRDEVRRLQETVIALSDATAAAIDPPSAVRASILRRIEAEATERKPAPANQCAAAAEEAHQQIWRKWESDPDRDALFTLRAQDGSWEETGVAGVRVRRLFVDRQSNRMTAMFKMDPGTSYPEHVHDGPEECYVLEGDLHVGDEFVMHKGDYQRATPQSEHGRQWTKGGCLLLVTCSLSDEMV